MTTENSKRMKGVGTSNVSHVSRKPLQYIHVTTPYVGHVAELTLLNSHFEAIKMSMISSLIQHGFFPVFSTVKKIMQYSDTF